MILEFILLIIFFMLGILGFYKTSKYFLFWILFYFGQLMAILSTMYIETGIFITEQGRYSYYTGASIRLLLMNILFFLVFFITLLLLSEKDKSAKYIKIKIFNPYYLLRFMMVIIFLLMTYLFANLLISGVPLFSEISRFVFWTEYSSLPFAKEINNQLLLFSFILGTVYLFERNNEKYAFSLWLFVFLIIYLILLSNKFSGLLLNMLLFLIPVFSNYDFKKIVNKKNVLISITLIIAFYSLIFLNYKYVENINNPNQAIMYRVLGLQGHTWWGIDRYVQVTNINNLEEIKKEINGLVNDDGFEYVGMYKLMLIIADQDLVEYFRKFGVSFTMAYPAIIIQTLGYKMAFLFQFIFALFCALLIFVFKKVINSSLWLMSIFIFKLYLGSYLLFTMGTFGDLFNFINVIIMYLVIVYFFILLSHKRGIKQDFKS